MGENTTAEAYVELGDMQYNLGLYKEAEGAYNKALMSDPDDMRALLGKAAALNAMGDFSRAKPELERAIIKEPNNAIAHAELGEALRKEGHNDDALTECDKALKIDPANSKARRSKGILMNLLGKYHEAISLLTDVSSVEPKDLQVFMGLGEAHYNLGEYKEALEIFNKALATDSGDLRAIRYYGLTLRALGDEKAVYVLKKLSKLAPGDSQVHVELGEALFQFGNSNEALIEYEKAIKLQPKNNIAFKNMGKLFAENNNCGKALDSLNSALEIDPNDISIKKIKAYVLCDSAMYADASNLMAEIIRDNEKKGVKDSWCLVLMGWALENLGKGLEAIEAYEMALSLETESESEFIKPWALKGRGNALYMLKRIEEAKPIYDQAITQIESSTKNVDAFSISLMGWCKLRLGHFAEAVRLFIDALSLNPQMIDAQFDLALALLCGKRYDLGLKEYLRGSEIAKKQSDILRRRGIISLALRSLVETADEQMGVDAKKKEEVKKILVNEMQEIRGKLEVNKERLSS